jgi:hypothetical protein
LIEKDIRGQNALIAKHFYYFGRNAVEIPPEYSDLLVGMGYKYRHHSDTVRGFLDWLQESFKPGIYGVPYDNPKPDASCVQALPTGSCKECS